MSTIETSPGNFSICTKSTSNNTGNSYSEIITGKGIGADGVVIFEGAILNSIITIIRNRGFPDYKTETFNNLNTYLFYTPSTQTAFATPSPSLLIDYLTKKDYIIFGTGLEITDTAFVNLVTYIANNIWDAVRTVAKTIDNTSEDDDICSEASKGRVSKNSCTCIFNMDITLY